MAFSEHDLYRLAVKPDGFPTAALEWKLCKTNTFLLSKVVPHQREKLLRVNQGRLSIRVPDMRMTGMMGKAPFDEVFLAHEAAFVAIYFWRGRHANSVITYIPIENFLRFTGKSIRLPQAKEAALFIARIDGSPVDD